MYDYNTIFTEFIQFKHFLDCVTWYRKIEKNTSICYTIIAKK